MNIEEVINRKKDQVIELVKEHFGESFIKGVYLAHRRLEPLDLYCVQMSIHGEKEPSESASSDFFKGLDDLSLKSGNIIYYKVSFCEPCDTNIELEISNKDQLFKKTKGLALLAEHYNIVKFSIIEDCGPAFEIILDAIKANDKFKHLCDNFYCYRLSFIDNLLPEWDVAFLYFKTSKELYTPEFCSELKAFLLNVSSKFSIQEAYVLAKFLNAGSLDIIIDHFLYKPYTPEFETILFHQKYHLIRNVPLEFYQEARKRLNEAKETIH